MASRAPSNWEYRLALLEAFSISSVPIFLVPALIIGFFIAEGPGGLRKAAWILWFVGVFVVPLYVVGLVAAPTVGRKVANSRAPAIWLSILALAMALVVWLLFMPDGAVNHMPMGRNEFSIYAGIWITIFALGVWPAVICGFLFAVACEKLNDR